MFQSGMLAVLGLVLLAITTGCDASLTTRPTPVPGAAATAARAAATAIPTPVRSPEVAPAAAASPRPGGPSPAASGSPSALDEGAALDQSMAEARRAFEQALSSPSLPGIEGLLLDSVSLASPTGGEVLERGAAAQWLRERAAAGLRMTDFLRNQGLASLVIVTEGWQNRAPISSGRVTFNLRRYDQAGREDDERGAWKIDVIAAE